MEYLKQKAEKVNEFRAEERALKKQHQQQEAAKQGQILAIVQQQQQPLLKDCYQRNLKP